MAIKLSFNETIRDACDKVREGEESGSSNDVSDSKASNQDIEKERSHSGSGDVISNAQKESKSRYGKAMQAGVSSPKLENRGEFSAIKAFLGTPPTVNTQGTQGLLNHFNSFHNPTPRKIVESEKDDPALNDYWKHYDKEGKKYDKRYFAARQEMSNAALRKVLSKSGSSGLPANVKITTAIDETSGQWLGKNFEKAWHTRRNDPEKGDLNSSKDGKESKTHKQTHSIFNLYGSRLDREKTKELNKVAKGYPVPPEYSKNYYTWFQKEFERGQGNAQKERKPS